MANASNNIYYVKQQTEYEMQKKKTEKRKKKRRKIWTQFIATLLYAAQTSRT